MQITFSIENTNQRYIQIEAKIKTARDKTTVHLPSWRPGRYELANFAKNIRNFKILDSSNKALAFDKLNKDTWEVDSKSVNEITVTYQFFANELNAGSTYVDEQQLYVNPVNCCVYTEEVYNEPVLINLNVPKHWDMATSLKEENGSWMAENVEELLDSPFISSCQLQHNSYESNGVLFHVWFNGEIKPDWDRLIVDFKKFTDSQIEKFTEFPVSEYHFINQILPTKSYHGVEHQKSTVISLGPSYDVFGPLYKELLGVSSHELYHTWNVKAIRPIDMYPYNFKEENYSKLGYICEGITTYQGDLFLLKSGVFNDQQYFDELDAQMQRHFDNFGRFNYSVAESSFDTWLDGYVPGAPGRKVSIYTEGCLLAFVTDVRIRKATNNKQGLDDVMKRLYFNYALQGKGVAEVDYQSTIEKLAGESFQDLFDDYINNNKPFESIIVNSLDYLGLELEHKPVDSFAGAKLGFKYAPSGSNFVIMAMYPGGPAEMGGLQSEDVILAVNGFACNGELDKWLAYFEEDTKTLTVDRKGVLHELTLPEVNRNFYMKYNVVKAKDPNSIQKRAFEHWSK